MELLLSPTSRSVLYISSSISSLATFSIPINSNGLRDNGINCGWCEVGGTTEGSFERRASRLLIEGVIFKGWLYWSKSSAEGATVVVLPWKCHASGVLYPSTLKGYAVEDG